MLAKSVIKVVEWRKNMATSINQKRRKEREQNHDVIIKIMLVGHKC